MTIVSSGRVWLALVAVLAAASTASAQVVYPPRPEKVDVQIRYRIRADRDERVRQFRDLESFLKKLDFERTRKLDDDLDILDPTAERFVGSIPSKSVLPSVEEPGRIPILDNPRVQTILFKPTDYQYPADAAAPVSVRIRITKGYLPAEQQKLHRQVVAHLGRLGFREAVAYDHDGYKLVRGDLPAGNVPRLMKDLRTEPAGAFLPETMPRELPSPLKDALPIRTIEVLANADLSLLSTPALAPNRTHYTPDLRAILDDPARIAKPLRVEVVMDRRLDSGDLEQIRSRLRGRFSREVVNPATQLSEQALATLEGLVGNVVTIEFPQAADVERYVMEPGVVVVRLPRAAVQTATAVTANVKATPAAEVLNATRLASFHKLGYRGFGTRIVVIASEFPDLGTAFGSRFLDKTLRTPVKWVDLTAELSAKLLPTPPGQTATAGTAAARAAHLAAPEATIVLVRVDPAAFYQVASVARFVRGEDGFTESMQSRIVELSIRTDELRRKNAEAVDQYRKAFQDFSDEEGPTKRRQQAKKLLDLLILEEADHAEAIGRGTVLQNRTRELAGADVVVNTLVWEAGFELDGLSDLGQFLESSYASEALGGPRSRSATRPRPAHRPIWVQASSPSLGSVWAGPFLDVQNNGVMEFANSGAALPAKEWTRELNFLGTRLPDGTSSTTLAAGAKIRLTVQWRETHDPNGYGGQESIFPLGLRVLQQLDPEGKSRATDDMKEIARSVGGPYRIYAEPGYGVYEQIVEFTVPADGRYCTMIEGATIFDPRLPALQRHVEVQPRLFAEFLGASPDKGRPIFASFAPKNAGVGIPGDVKAAITVGTTAGGLTGGGPGLELLLKPDLIADGSLDVGAKVSGSGVAAGFAAGAIAGLVSSGAPPTDVIGATGLRRGGPVNVPEAWLKVVPVKVSNGR